MACSAAYQKQNHATLKVTERKNMQEKPSSGNKFEMLRAKEYVDITEGLPFKNAQDFYDFVWDSFENDIHRFPIVGIRQDDNSVRVYMLLKNKINGKQEHRFLLDRLGFSLDMLEEDASAVAFSTSLEDHGSKKRTGLQLEFTAKNEYEDNPETKYITLGKGSDLLELSKSGQFTEQGKQTITEIFGRIGVKVVS
jgi:hypothetical protein